MVKQPDLHLFATYVACRLGCTNVVDIGCPQPTELARVYPQAQIVGLGTDLRAARSEYRFGRWVDREPGSDVLEIMAPDTATDSLLICTIDTTHPGTTSVIHDLKQLLEYAPAALVTTEPGCYVTRLRSLLESAGLCIDFIGRTVSDDVDLRRDTPLAILGNNHHPSAAAAPAGYRVVAMIASYNEEDIIAPSLERLIEQGVEVYLLDNWSTDRTVERAERFLGRGVIAIERFPSDGPSDLFPYISILNRKAELSTKLEADWFLHMDVDEVRRSPWPEVSLRDGLYRVERQGFNAVDHTVLKFLPIDNGYVDGSDFERYFRHFRFVFQQDFQIKMWKNDGKPVALGDGHRAAFSGRRVYPYNFLYKHYPIRSQQHGERKVFSERQSRMDPKELAAGWHRHYLRYHPDEHFLGDPSELTFFDDSEFHEGSLIERLSAIGPDERAAWVARKPERPRWRKVAGQAYRVARGSHRILRRARSRRRVGT